MTELENEYRKFERAMAETEKQENTTYAAIDPTKIPCKGPENHRDPLCVAMKKTEKTTFKAAALSERVIHSMQDLPDLESPNRG